MELRNRDLISDEKARREFDELVRRAGPGLRGRGSESERRAVAREARERAELFRRAAGMEQPPEELSWLDAADWAEVRQKSALASEAYGELARALDRPR